VIVGEATVDAHEGEAVDPGLCDQQTVERFTVMRGDAPAAAA
jgi:hypothetical protein